MSNQIYPPFHAKFLDDNGKVSKAWIPFIDEIHEMLKGIKNGTEDNYVSIDALKRLTDSGVPKA